MASGLTTEDLRRLMDAGVINRKSPQKRRNPTYGTVSSVSPFKVILDGDTAELPYSPARLFDHCVEGDRVYCVYTGNEILCVGVVDRAASGSGLLDYIWPVGSIYQTTDTAFDPNAAWGGTWERIKDRFLLAAGDTYSAGATGGEAEHTLTTSEIPAHTHGSKSLTGWFNPLVWETLKSGGIVKKRSGGTELANKTASSGSNFGRFDTTIDATHEHSSVGGGAAHNNMPPYVAVNVWKRTA